jgi:energy-coupling factor transporter ATP-binding protein EcfA2
MKLKMTIHKIKSIDFLEIDLPTQKGLYAITGTNGSGKSTVVTCAASAFFDMQMNEYFGKTDEDSRITFKFGDVTKTWSKRDGRWGKRFSGYFPLKGFYEGSLIYGNRFRNSSFQNLYKLDRINDAMLKKSPEFIRENLGLILHNDKGFYEKLQQLDLKKYSQDVGLSGDLFYYQKGEKRVSQFHMSTGENLLLSILNSIHIRNSDRDNLDKPCLLLLDEIEMALHPSSLKRLMRFLQDMSNQYNYAIYFSTHSIELISGIRPENIYFLDRHTDNSLEILNPCYPAYATRILYDHTGYDNIILVEDDLASEIVKRLLRKHALLTNKLVHVLPCGGYTNVIRLAKDVINSNLLGKTSKIAIILDGDVKEAAQKYVADNNISNNIPLNYLPIQSLEKYLRDNLFVNVDHKLFRLLNDYIFHQTSLTRIVEDYRISPDSKKDVNGKKFYDRIDSELRQRNKNRTEIIEMIVDYLFENKDEQLQKIVEFLKLQF